MNKADIKRATSNQRVKLMIAWHRFSRRASVIPVVVHTPIMAAVQRRGRVVENAEKVTIFRRYVGERSNEKPPNENILNDTVRVRGNDL